LSVESPVAQESVSAVRLSTCSTSWTRGWPGLLLLWAGWLIPQFVLLGPALIGRTVDIPVDLLVPHSGPVEDWSRRLYLPATKENASIEVRHTNELGDLVLQVPAAREFFARELRAGRLPIWNPSNFGGVPIVGWGYSPFEVPYYIFPSPVTVAWISLLQSLTVGLGVWLFLRRSLHLSYPAAALASWCAPLTGFMTLWHGWATIAPACWLPWLLIAIDATMKRPGGWGLVSTALLTALVLMAGHMGIAGLVLLTTGFYAVWRLAESAWARDWRRVVSAAPAIMAGWLLGFAISAAALLPFIDYVRTGGRMDSQLEGLEERPPEGLQALPAIVRPDVYGGQTRWTRTVGIALVESSSCAYAGLLAALWLAPLAWSHCSLRRQTIFWTLIVVVTLGWTLNIPGIVDVLRSRPLRPLAPLSYNRWTFVTSEALLILAAIGFDSLARGSPRFRWWWGLPILVTGVSFCWCVARLFGVTRELDRQGFTNYFLIGAGLSLVVLVGWTLTFRTGPWARWTRLALIGLLPLELFGFAWDGRRQADVSLYFPRIQILEKLAALPQGRIWGVACLPPNINLMCGLEDVRGYDAVDPLKYFKLFQLACDKESSLHYPECRSIMAEPAGKVDEHGLKLHPVADLLNVRYLIFRNAPPSGLPILLHQDDYWIIENPSVLPRAYVPTSAQVVKSDEEALERMVGFGFDPRKTVLMTDDLSLPSAMKGIASVRYETPTRISLEVEMQTPGLVLLSNRWDPGWHAAIDGAASPIYCVDYALRGFQVPAGKHTIVSTYDPPSLWKGLAITTAGGVSLLFWAIWQLVWRRRASLAAPRVRLAASKMPGG
jgi:hypothetical protein